MKHVEVTNETSEAVIAFAFNTELGTCGEDTRIEPGEKKEVVGPNMESKIEIICHEGPDDCPRYQVIKGKQLNLMIGAIFGISVRHHSEDAEIKEPKPNDMKNILIYIREYVMMNTVLFNLSFVFDDIANIFVRDHLLGAQGSTDLSVILASEIINDSVSTEEVKKKYGTENMKLLVICENDLSQRAVLKKTKVDLFLTTRSLLEIEDETKEALLGLLS